MSKREDNEIYLNTEYLNILRWISTIAVVFIHTITADSTIYNKSNILYIIRNLLNWCVPMFVMISGVLFLNPKKEIPIKKLLKKMS